MNRLWQKATDSDKRKIQRNMKMVNDKDQIKYQNETALQITYGQIQIYIPIKYINQL